MQEPPTARRPVVGVMGSGTQSHAERAGPLGAWLARLGVHLLTGGGGGVMEAVSRSFCEVSPRAGLSIGILPAVAGDRDLGEAPASGAAAAVPAPEITRPPSNYPNPWVELVIRTHLPYSGTRGTDPLSRNHINVLSADLLIALPGSAGTSSEVHLAARYHRPLIAHLKDASEIPDLPPETWVAPELSEVRAFVLAHLGRLADRR